MNRRGFFLFLPGAAVGVAAAATIAPAEAKTEPNVVRADPSGQRCACGCPHFHCVAVPHQGMSVEPNHNHTHMLTAANPPDHTHSYVGFVTTMRSKPVCAWCGAPWNERGPWKGPTS